MLDLAGASNEASFEFHPPRLVVRDRGAARTLDLSTFRSIATAWWRRPRPPTTRPLPRSTQTGRASLMRFSGSVRS